MVGVGTHAAWRRTCTIGGGRICAAIVGLVWLAANTGCSRVLSYSSQKPSLLRPPQMPPDAVGLEIYFVRFPLGDPEVNQQLWQELDEQMLAPSVRRQLWKNGFRVAVVGTAVPVRLARLLKMSDQPPADQQEGLTRVQIQQPEKVEPWISCRRLSLRPGCRSEIIASGIYQEMTILRPEAQGLAGQTFRKAQALFGLYVQSAHDGRMQLELVPEVHYGDPAQRWVGDQGMFRLEVRRERKVFSELAIRTRLAPGEILVLSCFPQREGSLGWYFFTQTAGGDPHQKLLLVRLAQTQQDPLFLAEPALPSRMEQPTQHP